MMPLLQVKAAKRCLAAAMLLYLLSTVYLHTLLDAQTSSNSSIFEYSGSYPDNDVLEFDHAVLDNVRATIEGARSDINPSEPADLRAIPLMATVDRRPIVIRKQLLDDARSLTAGGDLLGCAMTATTFVTRLKRQDVSDLKKYEKQHTCQLCFRFSDALQASRFLPNITASNAGDQTARHTKCVAGATNVYAYFAKWQQREELEGQRFQSYGYPWTLDCVLPSGIKELTCRHISRMNQDSLDGLRSVHLETVLVLGIRESNRRKGRIKPITVRSKWPWAALTSHDDNRADIAHKLSYTWNDDNSCYVPKNATDVKLAHVEGPGYDANLLSGALPKATTDSRGGVHVRFLVNLFGFIRNSPGSTHIIAVADNQSRQSYQYLMKALDTKISVLYPNFWQDMLARINQPGSSNLIPMSNQLHSYTKVSDMTLMNLLRLRNINIKMVPILTPPILFTESVCAGQYQFTTYLAARYGADYNVMMFIDGDTTMKEQSMTSQQIFFDRFFSDNSTKCAGHRFQLIEQYVAPKYDNDASVLECIHDLDSHSDKWKYVMANCALKEGHIVGRTDSIYAFGVHHPIILAGYAPRGVEDCNSGNTFSERFFLSEKEMVQLHLRDRERKVECACFVNHKL